MLFIDDLSINAFFKYVENILEILHLMDTFTSVQF